MSGKSGKGSAEVKPCPSREGAPNEGVARITVKAMMKLGIAALVATVGIFSIGAFGFRESTAENAEEHLPVDMSSPVIHGELREQPRDFVSGGVLFQKEGCPYTLSEEEAKEVLADDSELGNIITLDHHGGGRTGNHYMTLSAYLAMGYCCRSRLLTLPGKDSTLPWVDGAEFSPNVRWFGFSNASLPQAKFDKLRDDPEVCRPETTDGGSEAFGYREVHNKLLECMNVVYLRGCERVYLGNLVENEAFCPERDDGDQGGAGSLVMHIRSGDIFDPKGEGQHRKGFGQPPLQFYLLALKVKEWDSVTIITASWKELAVNPTFRALEVMASAGFLGPNVRRFKKRSLLTDVRDMLCADGLVSSRSSLSFMTFPYTRAKFFFVPAPCGKGLYRRMKHPPIKAFFDNTTLLALERPDAEIYGTRWRADAPEYTVYHEWNDQPEQLLEMVTYNGIEAFERCS